MTAFHGGNLALADFQVTPPLGRSILTSKVNCIGESKVRGREKEERTACDGAGERSPHKEVLEMVVARLKMLLEMVTDETSGMALHIKASRGGEGAEEVRAQGLRTLGPALGLDWGVRVTPTTRHSVRKACEGGYGRLN